MSATDDVFNVHDVTSYSKQNGDMSPSSSGSRATTEKIASVLENPFYKNFGVRHIPRSSYRPDTSDSDKRLSSNGRFRSTDLDDENDDIGEYKPGSGFVHRLLDKFSSLTAREDSATSGSVLRRSSSLDELPGENDTAKQKTVTFKEASHASAGVFEKPTNLSLSKLSHKAKSIESLNHAHRKPHHHHHRAVALRHVERKWDKEKSSVPPKSPRDHHIVAPDVDLARDDIIIIEKTPPLPVAKDATDDESESDDGTPQILSYREDLPQDELPKPNTVLSVRSFFEGSSKAPSTGGIYSRRYKAESSLSSPTFNPKLQIETTQVSPSLPNQDNVSNRVSVQSPSPVTSPRIFSNDTHAKPVLLPSSSAVSKPFEYSRRTSDTLSYSNLSKSVIYGTKPVASSSDSTPRSDDNSSDSSSMQNAFDSRTSLFERNSVFDSTKASENYRPTPSPRSTASVKPTISSKPSAPVKPFPLSAPASAATSYRKSSPVVPVAPFKDKQEDIKEDGQPVMIFTKSKLSPRREKSKRTKDYLPLNDTVKKVEVEKVEEDKIIIPKDAQKIIDKEDSTKLPFEKNNKVLSQRKTSTDSNSKSAEKVTADQNKIIHTKQHTAIEINKSPKLVLEHEHGHQSEKLKLGTDETDSLKFPKTRSQFKSSVTSKPRESAKQRIAPTPSEHMKKQKQQSMLYISSSDSSGAEPSPPETPRTNPEPVTQKATNVMSHEELMPETPRDKKPTPNHSFKSKANENVTPMDKPVKKVINEKTDSTEAPIKGIPSIIAQRLKQQNSDPSQVADHVMNLSESNDRPLKTKLISDETNGDSDTPSPRKRLTPAPASAPLSESSNKNNTQDSISSEIENEIAAVRKKMGNRPKSGGMAPIFDSSQLAKKRKENQKQKAAAQGLVPPLDLSSITDDRSKEYQPPRKEIQPCNIKFIGENAKTSRSLLVKKRTIKVSIHFNDVKTETFEYPSEEHALEKYLEEHPHESDDIIFLESFGGGESGDSSDDVQSIDIIETPVTPRGDNDESLLKSNTALSHTGSLQSYRGRFQQDFEFGSALSQPEPSQKPVEPEPVDDPNSMMLRPAEEDDTNTWSTNSSSDLLF